jgi:hypothetical protein
MVPPTHQLETFQLGSFTVPRLWNGLWQLSSNAWGSAPSAKIRRHMAQYVDQGYIAFGKQLSVHCAILLSKSPTDMVRLLFLERFNKNSSQFYTTT